MNNLLKTAIGTASLLGATLAATPASAVPIDITNVRPTVVNAAFPGEGSVQSILDTVFGPGAAAPM